MRYILIQIWFKAKYIFVFQIIIKQTDAKAVARKSSGKKSLPNSSRLGLSQSAVHGKKEDQGKIITHHNELHQDIAFEPHQCGEVCVSDFPYTEANFKSKYRINVNHFHDIAFVLGKSFPSLESCGTAISLGY